MQKILITLGFILVALGLVWPWISSWPLGRLPGDFVIKRDNFTFYFPLTTMVVISVVISAVLWLFRR